MGIDETKDSLKDFVKYMSSRWFDGDNIQDVLCKGVLNAIVSANINKYDEYMNYFTDEKGDVRLDEFIDYMIDGFTPYKIDLTKFGVPFLPKKILLLTKQDLMMLKNTFLAGNGKSDNYRHNA